MIERYPSCSKIPSHYSGKLCRFVPQGAVNYLVHFSEICLPYRYHESPIGIGVWGKPIMVPLSKWANPSWSLLEIANNHAGLGQTHHDNYIFGIYTLLCRWLEVIPTIPVPCIPGHLLARGKVILRMAVLTD